MTKIFLKITVICAAGSMAASAWAQSPPQEQQPGASSPNRSWSTKQLTATGRNTEKSVRASKLAGAQVVSDSSGQRVGTIQDVIINANSGRIDFALLSLNSSDASSSANYDSSVGGKLVPVPWALLRTSASSSQYSSSSEQPAFTLHADQNKLNGAPTVDASDLSKSEWQQRIYSYYGVTPQPAGGADSLQGATKESTPPRPPQPTP